MLTTKMEYNPKYRPSLTPQQISYIISICDAESRPEIAPMAAELSKQLKVFAFKMQLGLVSAAFNAAPKQSIEEKLDLEAATPAQRRELAYRKWQGSPQLCTAAEIKMAHTYRYENNMLTTEEEEKYESSILIQTNTIPENNSI